MLSGSNLEGEVGVGKDRWMCPLYRHRGVKTGASLPMEAEEVEDKSVGCVALGFIHWYQHLTVVLRQKVQI